MPATTRSLRQFLQGSLADFAESSDMAPLVTPTSLTNLVVVLADLQEEGVLLTPEVYLCNDLESTLKLLPDRQVVNLGYASTVAEAVSDGIKKCATLAMDGWCIFIAPHADLFRFGLFRGSLNPISVSINQTFFSGPLEGLKVVRLFRTARGCVELRNHTGNDHSILLSDRVEGAPLPSEHTTKLTRLICRDASTAVRSGLETLLSKTLERALGNCHGTLIAVTANARVPKFLNDGVVLAEPIEFGADVREKLGNSSDPTIDHRIRANASLLNGMIGSDGIVLFNTKGALIAYRCFVTSPNKVDGRALVGGARTRAFQALSKNLGNGLAGAFMQSQDGWTKYIEATHVVK